MRNTWQLQEAKNRFSEVVEEALSKGPQIVTKRGEEAVVVVSIKEYKKITKPTLNLVEFFRKSPLVGINISFDRSKDTGREIDL